MSSHGERVTSKVELYGYGDPTYDDSKLIRIGYLHLAYLATEITLHRHLLRSLSTESNAQLISVVRIAAHARLTSATDFVKSLRPEHLQSFWYCASTYCFSLIGAYIGLLWATSHTKSEAESYRERLDEYRWVLRLSSRSAEILERAAGLVGASTGVLVKGVPAHLEGESQSEQDEEQDGSDDGSESLYESSAIHDAEGTVESSSVTSPVVAQGLGENWNQGEVIGMHMASVSPTEYHQVQDLFWPELALPGSGYEVVHVPTNYDAASGQFM
jgi:hypothetical protein